MGASLTVVMTHHNADLDALASMIAATRLYEGAVALRGQIVNPQVQRFLALHKDALGLTPFRDIDPASVARVVVVDVRDKRRLKEYEPILAACAEVEVWDHHPPCAHDLDATRVVVEPVGACVTLLVEQLRARGAALSASEATVMMLGLYSDTGQLTYDSTQPRDIDAAGWLLRQGANLRVVQRYLQEEYSPAQQQLFLSLMGTMEEESVSAVEVALAVGEAPDFVHGASEVVHRLMVMGGHDACVGVIRFARNGRVQVIGRSRVPYVDMGALMRELGGGGHAGAAAATFKGVGVEEVVAQLKAALHASAPKPTRVSDLMTAPAQTIAYDATLEALDALLVARHIRGVPVTRDGAMIGVISIRDVERARAAGDMGRTVGSYMSHHVKVIAPEEPLEDALVMMSQADIGRLPVVDEAGRLVGIVSRSDIMRRLYQPSGEEGGWIAPVG
jgi:tRNA nucleotidyltransferase (CCA-adding enzyme)